MAYLGRKGAVAPLTSADIPVGIVEGTDIAFLENASGTQNLGGTYSTERMYLNDSYTLTGDVTITGHLALGTVADSDVVITQDGTERTITGSGTLESGRLVNDPQRTSVTGMTGELGTGVTLGSAVTGSPNLNLGNATFPALHGIVGTSGCHVYCSAVSTATGSAVTKIAFDTELFDIADEFVPNKFTVTTAGYYYMHVSVCIQDFADMKAMQARIYKNGSALQLSRNNNGRTDHLVDSVTTIKYLAANDYIEGYVYNGWSTTKNTTSGDNLDTFMIIMRLT